MALRSSASTDEQQFDQVHRITFSEDASELEGYDFADFFASGEAPAFDKWQKINSMNFFNAEEQLFAKYIQLDFEDGASARGYWHKHGSDLLPTQLTIFRQEDSDTGEAEFMETVTTIKFDSTRERFESQTRTLKKSFRFGDETIAEYKNYGTENQLEARYEYGTDYAAGNYGKLIASTDFNGSWARYEYDPAGRIAKEVTPFMDAPADAPEDQCNVTVYDYEPLHPDETVLLSDSRTRTIIRYTLGTETARSYHLYFEDQGWSVTAAAPGAPYDAAGNIVNKTFRYTSGAWAGCTWKTENADGSSSLTTYEEINPVIDEEGNILHDTRITTLSGRLPDHGTREVVINNYADHVISRETYDIETGLLIGGSTYEYNEFGKMTKETTVDGDVTSYVYNCCGPRFVTAPDGSVTEYGYDAFNRQVFTTAAGITTMQYYDADDNVIESVVIGKEGGELVTRYEYNADGELIRETNPAGAATTYENGVDYSKTTDALGGTVISTRYLDGSPKSTHGTAAYPRSYKYGIENGEPYALECAAGIEQRRTYTDFLGRSYKTVYPDNFTETTVYDAKGRAIRQENSCGARSLSIYDETTGELKYSVIKRLESTSDIDWENDAITEYESGYTEHENQVVNYSKTYTHSDSARIEVSATMSARDGKKSWQTEKGRTSTSETLYLGNSAVEQKTTDFAGVSLTNYTDHGMLMTSSHDVTGETSYVYDEFNRNTGSDHEENGVMVSVRNTLNELGQPTAVTQSAGSASRTVSYTYDLLERRTTETSPEGIITAYAYNAQGQVIGMHGGVYRQEYRYNDRGQLENLITYQDENTPQVTTFAYDSRGRMIRKNYADNTAESYTYYADGKVAKYIKGDGQIHTYTYDLAGGLTNISDESNFSRDYEYDMQGRVVKATDHTGEYELAYNEFDQPLAEAFPTGMSVDRTYDSLQRPASEKVGSKELSYTYDDTGRLSAIRIGSWVRHCEYQEDSNQTASTYWLPVEE